MAMAMAMASLSTGVQVESFLFPPFIKPPLGATNTLFLGGAGAREYVMEGILISVMAYGLYLEDVAIPSLAVKWKGKTAAELGDSLDFYKDIVTGPYEKSVNMTMVVRLIGEQYSETARGLSIGVMKEYGTYTNADAATLDKFLEAFKGKIFEPGTSVFFTFSPSGSITLRNLLWATSKHDLYLMQNYSVMHWSSLLKRSNEVVNVAMSVLPTLKYPGSFSRSLSMACRKEHCKSKTMHSLRRYGTFIKSFNFVGLIKCLD